MDTPTPNAPGNGQPNRPPQVPAAPTPPLAPPTQAGDIGGDPTPDATGGVIPYKNPCALISYYLGIFGLIPMLGLPLALAAIILGIIGLRQRARKQVYGGQSTPGWASCWGSSAWPTTARPSCL